MRPLPHPTNLRQAVFLVLKSNKDDGYDPRPLQRMTGGGYVPDLLGVCERLIVSGEVMTYLETVIRTFPALLTLQDLVAEYGGEWGFTEQAIQAAKAQVAYLDQQARRQRYEL